jgi:hypothetical protein
MREGGIRASSATAASMIHLLLPGADSFPPKTREPARLRKQPVRTRPSPSMEAQSWRPLIAALNGRGTEDRSEIVRESSVRGAVESDLYNSPTRISKIEPLSLSRLQIAEGEDVILMGCRVVLVRDAKLVSHRRRAERSHRQWPIGKHVDHVARTHRRQRLDGTCHVQKVIAAADRNRRNGS